jgi:hypothetical protein
MTERKNAPSNPRYNDGMNWPFLFGVLITGKGPLLIFSDFNLNHDIYANSPDIIPDLGLILRNTGQIRRQRGCNPTSEPTENESGRLGRRSSRTSGSERRLLVCAD